MSVTNYNCIITNHTTGISSVTTVGVLTNGYEPLSMPIGSAGADAYSFMADEGTAAESVSRGLFNSGISFFGCFKSGWSPPVTYTGAYKIGSIAGPSDSYLNSKISILFPGGCSVLIAHSGYSTVDVSYSCPSGSVSGNFGQTQLVGLMSSSVYLYEDTNGRTYRALMHPIIEPFTKTVNNVTYDWFSLGQKDKGSGYTYYYPSNLTSINSESSDSSIESFNKKVSIMDDFWGIVDRYNSTVYICTIVSGVGGTVNPTSFWASANEPRMFTVTPDEHHAIHSVTAYNTATNAQIPLQESAMDLLTGAKSYMFTMPAANVRIVVEFRSIEITIPVTVIYTSPRGRVYTTSFNLLQDDSRE